MSKWFDLSGRVRDVNVIKKYPKVMGKTYTKGRKFDIQIARKHMKDNLSIVETLLHEFLHLWMELILHLKIIKLNKEEKHEIIYSIEHFASHVLHRRINWKKRI